jgi:hypothetical protein
MSPSHLLVLSLACGLAAIGIVWASNPMARVVWTLAAIWAIRTFFTGCLADTGIFLASNFKLYGLGKWLCKSSKYADELLFASISSRAMSAISLSRVELMSGSMESAIDECKRTLALNQERKDFIDCLNRFHCLSIAGSAYFHLAE